MSYCMVMTENLSLPTEWLQTWPLANNRECLGSNDAPRQSGVCSLDRTYENWKKVTVDDQIELMTNKRMKINVSTGSSTRQPVSHVSDEKENNGVIYVFREPFHLFDRGGHARDKRVQ